MKYAKLFALLSLLCLCFTACSPEPADTTAPSYRENEIVDLPVAEMWKVTEAYEQWEYRDRFTMTQFTIIESGFMAGMTTPQGYESWESYSDLSPFSAYTEQEVYSPQTQTIPVYIHSSNPTPFDFNDYLCLEKWNEETGSWRRLSYGTTPEYAIYKPSQDPSQQAPLPNTESEGITYLYGTLAFSDLLYPEWEEWPVGKYRAVAFIGANSAALYAPFEIVEG